MVLTNMKQGLHYYLHTEYVSVCLEQGGDPTIFSVCTSHLQCNDESVTPHKEVLIVVKAEDPCYDKSVLEKFTDPMVSLTWSCMCSQTYVHNNVMQHFYRRLIQE